MLSTEFHWNYIFVMFWLSDFTFTFHFHALEEEMATHSSVLAWRIPGMGEPGGLYGVAQSWTRLKRLSSSSSSSSNNCMRKLFSPSPWPSLSSLFFLFFFLFHCSSSFTSFFSSSSFCSVLILLFLFPPPLINYYFKLFFLLYFCTPYAHMLFSKLFWWDRYIWYYYCLLDITKWK